MQYVDENVPTVNADDGAADRPIIVSIGWDLYNVCNPLTVMWSEFAEVLSAAPTFKKKDECRVYVFGGLDGPFQKHLNRYVPDGSRDHIGYHRVGDNAVELHGLALDFDEADTTFDAVVERVRGLGLTAVVHTSYNNDKIVTKPKYGAPLETTLAKVPPRLLPRIEGGVIRHKPWPKIHVLFVFNEPWIVPRKVVNLSDEDKLKKAARQRGNLRLSRDTKDLHNAAYRLFAHDFSHAINAAFDEACGDITHAIYMPAQRPDGGVYRYEYVKGAALDWQKYIDRAACGERAPGRERALVKKGSVSATAKKNTTRAVSTKDASPKVAWTPRIRGGWDDRLLRDFELATALAEVVEVRGDKLESGKIEIKCPYDEEHSDAGNPDDRACVVFNASERSHDFNGHQWPAMACQHSHCHGRRAQDFVPKLLDDGIITSELFADERFRIKRKKASTEDIHAALRAANEAREARMKS
ncbi:MAG: hypothetical protein ABL931_20250 [Usitatibacteraceae bacterium]